MTYSLIIVSTNLAYSGTDLSISSSTGEIKTLNNNMFTSVFLKVAVTSTYASIPCSGTAFSTDFTIS